MEDDSLLAELPEATSISQDDITVVEDSTTTKKTTFSFAIEELLRLKIVNNKLCFIKEDE